MNRRFSRLAGLAAVTVIMLPLLAQMPVSAQDRSGEFKSGDNRSDGSEPRNEYRKIEGSWNNVTTRRNCVTGAPIGTFPSMFTFSQGGTMWEAGAGSDPKLRSASHGVWSAEGRAFTRLLFSSFGLTLTAHPPAARSSGK